jgi:hypothetical protein
MGGDAAGAPFDLPLDRGLPVTRVKWVEKLLQGVPPQIPTSPESPRYSLGRRMEANASLVEFSD